MPAGPSEEYLRGAIAEKWLPCAQIGSPEHVLTASVLAMRYSLDSGSCAKEAA